MKTRFCSYKKFNDLLIQLLLKADYLTVRIDSDGYTNLALTANPQFGWAFCGAKAGRYWRASGGNASRSLEQALRAMVNNVGVLDELARAAFVGVLDAFLSDWVAQGNRLPTCTLL